MALRIILALCSALFPHFAAAQFLQTDLNTYQLPDPQQQVVIITTPKGIFVAQAPRRGGSIGSFEIDQLTLDNSTSAFLAYTAKTRVPEKLILAGGSNEYRIRGTFNIQLSEQVRLAAAMNSGSVPYITVVFSRPGSEAIIGFLGDQVVVNLPGAAALEILEAGAMPGRFGNVIAPYSVKQDQQLYLKEEKIPAGSGVGLLAPQENECLNDGVRSIAAEDFEVLPKLKPAEQKTALKKLLNDSRKSQKLDQFVILNAAASRITAINVDSGELVAIQERELGGSKACVVEPLALKKSPPG